MLDKTGFDQWAEEYDGSVERSDETGTYPFVGYKEILKRIFQKVMNTSNAKVLDLGFGTAVLTYELYKKDCKIYGQDFSKKMIELAHERMPDAHLYEGDLTKGLAEPLKLQNYDYIVATYSLHHLTDKEKITLLHSLLQRLNENGMILIGDVAFKTREELETCRKQTGNAWDDEEVYCVVEELKSDFPDLTYIPVSYCSGIIEISKSIK